MPYKILLWGTGIRASAAIKNGHFDNCDIAGFVDTYKNEKTFLGYSVFRPEELPGIMGEIDYLILINDYFLENIDLCLEQGISWEKLVIVHNVKVPFSDQMFLRLKEIAPSLYDQETNRPLRLTKVNEYDSSDPDIVVGKGRYSNYSLYMMDYFRYRTFELMSREIKKNRVPGAAAELGVFRGNFAALINEVFPEKKLYLFDTFEGFSQEEGRKELEMGRCDEGFLMAHKGTSVERMIGNLPNPERCVICKGLFPACITEAAERESYAFVSIDVDFEESSYQGLKFFYPRLSEGGAIFLHDYTTYYLDGVRQAVARYEQDTGIRLKKVPLADRAGTLVIVK